jgi:uncharacterized damage-inducible protein DinB
MSIAQMFLAELEQEGAATRKILAQVPDNAHDWAPHSKSMKLQRLATHIAELYRWPAFALQAEELDVAQPGARPELFTDTQQMLAFFDQGLADSKEALAKITDEDLKTMWTLRHGERVIFTIPRTALLRRMVLSHSIHHRGQLSVYLRLLDVPVPGMYGPSADER